MLSALMISPFIFFASKVAKLDFPDAVGPAIKIIFFTILVDLDPKIPSLIIRIYNS